MPEISQRKPSLSTPPPLDLNGGTAHLAGPDAPFSRAGARVTPGSTPVLVSHSPRMQELLSVVDRLAGSNAPVLISGAHGTGKELVARTLYGRSPHAHGPVETIAADGLTADDLAQAALRCDRGALIITAVENLDDDTQRMLLGLLDRVTPRIFATTSVRLEDAAKANTFRPELLYRIQVLSLRVPALSERPQDLSQLWNDACAASAKDAGKPIPTTPPDVMAQLQRYSWPGNVRELENAARHVVACANRGISMSDLPPQMLTSPTTHDEIRLPGMRLRDLERIAILKTYEATGSAKATAEMLDISVRKVHYRLKEYRSANAGTADGPVSQ